MKEVGEALSSNRRVPSQSSLSAFESLKQSNSARGFAESGLSTARTEQSEPADVGVEAPNAQLSVRSRIRLTSTERFALGIVQAMDSLLIAVSGFIVYFTYIGWGFGNAIEYAGALTIILGMYASLARKFGSYDFDTLTAWPAGLGRLLGVLAIVFLLFMGLAFGLKISEHFSRIWVFSTFSLSAGLVFIAHGAFIYVLKHWSVGLKLRRRVALLGASEQAQQLLERLMASDKTWHRVLGIFDDRVERIGELAFGQPVLGNTSDLEKWVRDGKVTDVIITLPWTAHERLSEIINRLSHLPVNILLGPDLIAYRVRTISHGNLEGVSLFKVLPTPISDWSAILKIFQDKFLASLFLLFSGPLLAAVAMAIKIESPGPVFFRQKRCGFNNEVFWIHKFRTMHHTPSERDHAAQAKPQDERVTRLGWFLRRTSLDELPQLFDVLRGRMSLVGPRPHAVEHDTEYSKVINRYYARHKVRPGITGWAQVNGWRGETPELRMMQARIEHDIYYIENWTPWLDFKILCITLVKGWYHRNAY